ncbi:MAG: hypothetical protein UT14_C0033G0016 [Candidatus Shapirobacteria bacterium GW2011_GWE1_38_92]|uniref:Uncharacterized protein n=1 Tax=Candidatus Shapirobacteria bacterium GW2011_GWE1_38_92 TaxID=1618489 RepID=A0A0G0PMX8_9BACT|nr:MAG: hypothetical protein UT14_C0033G0016 [Candidatus Shapirobacteria bacterium GW2011_GWE1_38_92]
MDIESGVGGFNVIILDGDFAGGEGAGDEGRAELCLAMDGEIGADDHIISEAKIAMDGGGVGFDTGVPGLGSGLGIGDGFGSGGGGGSGGSEKITDFGAEGTDFVRHDLAERSVFGDDIVGVDGVKGSLGSANTVGIDGVGGESAGDV